MTRRHRKKRVIELAYEQAEAAGIVQLNEDEAGPYQAIPQPGASWQAEGHPIVQPHEYERGGTAKLLTLFRPSTGHLRAKGVLSAPNIILHPWRKRGTRRSACRDREGAPHRRTPSRGRAPFACAVGDLVEPSAPWQATPSVTRSPRVG